MAPVAYLECSLCREKLSADSPRTVCPNDKSLLYVRYTKGSFKQNLQEAAAPGGLLGRDGLWRYARFLPAVAPVSLGEGFTPLLPSRRFPRLSIKEEGLNPTGSWQARGISVAVSVAKSWGLKKLAIASSGNSGAALAAYAASAGVEAHVFMPRAAALPNRLQCANYGARLTVVDGTIGDCLRRVEEGKGEMGWFDVSRDREPFRIEGDKTMGYEVAEQRGWKLPEGIVSFAAGGGGLVGMWKAFQEIEELGWIGRERPKMVAVELSGCAPLAAAPSEGTPERPTGAPQARGEGEASAVAGLKPILEVLDESGGLALTVGEAEICEARADWARTEGVWAAPAGAATFAAYAKLRAGGLFGEDDDVVLLNPASPLKYLAGSPERDPREAPSRQIGGIIGPY